VTDSVNLRYELRAYESTDACRLAWFLGQLTADPGQLVARDKVANLWAERYPRHQEQTGNNNVRGRISGALSLLKIAVIARPEEPSNIVVVDPVRLNMAAGNLTIVEDSEGRAIRPGLWSGRPLAPPHLHEVQALLEQARQSAPSG